MVLGPVGGLTPNTTAQDATGAFAVLQLLSDPAAAQQRLQDLQAKIAESNTILDQAKAENEKMLAAKAAAEEAEANANASLAAFRNEKAAHETDMVAREKKVSDLSVNLAAREKALAAQQADFDSTKKATDASFVAREQKIAADTAASQNDIAAKAAAFEADLQSRTSAIQAREAETAALLEQTKQAKADADQLKATYDSQLSKLRSIVQP